MSSPSTNPSSCDSTVDCMAPLSCKAAPSTNQQYTNSLECSSPAVAQAVPTADPSYPEASGPKMYFTTAMANQAAEDLAQGKVKTVREWYEQYQRRTVEEDRLRNLQNQPAQNENLLNPQNNNENELTENKSKRVKVEDEPGPSNANKQGVDKEERVYANLGETKENPLRCMEIMANSSVFKPSAKIAEVVTENQNKRERAGKPADNLPNPSIPLSTPFSSYNQALPGPSPYPFPYPGIPPVPFPGMSYPMAYPRVPSNHPGYPNYPGWPAYYHPGGQVYPSPYGNVSFPPGYPFGYPPHPIIPGPLSGPPLSHAILGKPPAGPMTAPTTPYAPPLIGRKTPSQACPLSQQNPPSSRPHPTPLFSFSMEHQVSPMFQDLSNKHPV